MGSWFQRKTSYRHTWYTNCQKMAVVTPLLKKASLEPHELKNYRPVSNLSFVSKLVERVAVKQLSDHLESNGLLPLLQSAYRSHHSTETALLKVLSDVLTAIDDKKVTLLALLDLSAAFDCVDHKQCDESRIRLNNDSSWSSMAVFLCSVRWCHSRVPNSVD